MCNLRRVPQRGPEQGFLLPSMCENGDQVQTVILTLSFLLLASASLLKANMRGWKRPRTVPVQPRPSYFTAKPWGSPFSSRKLFQKGRLRARRFTVGHSKAWMTVAKHQIQHPQPRAGVSLPTLIPTSLDCSTEPRMNTQHLLATVLWVLFANSLRSPGKAHRNTQQSCSDTNTQLEWPASLSIAWCLPFSRPDSSSAVRTSLASSCLSSNQS